MLNYVPRWRTHFNKGTIQGLWWPSLVLIGPLISEEKVIEWKVNTGRTDKRTTDAKTVYWRNKIICYGNKLIFWGNNIHSLLLHKGDMKICSPEKSHISRGQRPREIWLFRGWTNFHISLMQGKWMFYSTRPTFWWILPNEIFWPSLFTKLLFRNISGVIFTNMEYRYMTKALNLENFE